MILHTSHKVTVLLFRASFALTAATAAAGEPALFIMQAAREPSAVSTGERHEPALHARDDCNNNGIPDDEDLANCDGSPWCSDCNTNGVLDECDIDLGLSADCNTNQVPDECDVAPGGEVSPGDWLIVSRTYGTVYAIDPASRNVRSLITGQELRDECEIARGAGNPLASYRTDLLSLPGGRLLARVGSNVCQGLYDVDVTTGDRTLLPGTDGPDWFEEGGLTARDPNTIVAVTDGYGTSYGYVVSYDLATNTSTLVSGPTRGDGPLPRMPQDVAIWDADTVLVTEFGMPGGVGLFAVQLSSGNRTFLSRLTTSPLSRVQAYGGQISPVTLDRGSGPVVNDVCRDIAVVNGRILAGMTVEYPPQTFHGGILEIDPDTGNRTLLVGAALDMDTLPPHLVVVEPSNPQGFPLPSSITAMQSVGYGDVVFTSVFDTGAYKLNVNTLALDRLFDIGNQVSPTYGVGFRPSGLAAYDPPDCNSNGVLDVTDVRVGTSLDCNLNDVPDDCDLASGHSLDTNTNGIPDECESPPVCPADSNCDDSISWRDIDYFVAAMISETAWADMFLSGTPSCTYANNDVNGDVVVNWRDIDPFVAVMGTSCL